MVQCQLHGVALLLVGRASIGWEEIHGGLHHGQDMEYQLHLLMLSFQSICMALLLLRCLNPLTLLRHCYRRQMLLPNQVDPPPPPPRHHRHHRHHHRRQKHPLPLVHQLLE